MALTGGRHPVRATEVWRIALHVYIALILLFLILPVLIVFPISFSSSAYLQFPPPGWSLRWYSAYFNDAAWISSTLRSIKIASITTVLATLLGVPLAFSLVRGRYMGRGLITQLSATPLIVPAIIYSIAIYGVFARYRLIGDWRGIMLAHTVQAVPYVLIVVTSALRTYDITLEQAAMGLGAGRFRAVWRITLPQLRPSIITAMFFAFISSFDELVVAMFLGGSNMTLPKKMFDNILNAIDPTIAAVSVLQIALISSLLIAVSRFGIGIKPASR